MHQQHPHESAYRPTEARTYFATPRVPLIRDLNFGIDVIEGKEVYPRAGLGPWGKQMLRQVRIAEELSECMSTKDRKLNGLERYLIGKAGLHFHIHVDIW